MENKNKTLSEEHKRKIGKSNAIALKIFWQNNPEHKNKLPQLQKGNIPWNKGLTKETDVRVASISKSSGKTLKRLFKEGKLKAWNKGFKMWKNKKHPMLGINQSEESKKKMSENKKGKITWMKGKHHSVKTKKLISEYHKSNPNYGMGGKKHSKKTLKKMSNSQIGINYMQRHGEKKAKELKEIIKKNRSKQIFPLVDTSIELKIQDFLTTLKVEFVTHKYMNIKNSYQCDIFVPSLNLVIECDGDFFHMNPNKYSPEDKTFKNSMTAKERWALDNTRTKQLLEKGYKVIRIWENEIRIMTVDKFKNKLLEVKK